MPAYQQVRQLLLHKLKNGEIKPGGQIPSETQLCNKYDVSRVTIRQAVASLVNDGLMHTVPGKGTFANDIMQEAHLEYVSSFISETRRKGLNPSVKVISEEIVKADREMAENLKIDEGEEIMKIKRVKAVNNVPLYTELRYIPRKYCPDLVEKRLGGCSLTELAGERCKLNIKSRDIVVVPAALDSESALLLNAEKGLPGLLVIETLFLDDGSPFKWEKRMHKSGLHFTAKVIAGGKRGEAQSI